MRTIALLTLFILLACSAGAQDTLQGFASKISGEDILYYSPLRRFANKALLTRANGRMPVLIAAPTSKHRETVVYEFLIGHSSGTSGADRRFDISLNDSLLFTLTTPRKQTGKYLLQQRFPSGLAYSFSPADYDINGDAFGFLYLEVPAALVQDQAVFRFFGPDQGSRDWLMVFDYRRSLRIDTEPTALVLRREHKRMLNLYIDNPGRDSTPFTLESPQGRWDAILKKGYNVLHLPCHEPGFTGTDTLFMKVGNQTIQKTVDLKPVRLFEFAVIHHSHNDIGYSHLQAEVERIQSENIRTALNWTRPGQEANNPAVWHVESLWAVENFLRVASAEERRQFLDAVRKGRIALSANYANILTGLCRSEEQAWNIEYARLLGETYGLRIPMAMITDIPGIKASALKAYVDHGVKYLSVGANYVETLPDKGDRIGGVLRELGDKPFYWKASPDAKEKLLVWHAGKGYSYFHSITASEKQAAWESRISAYCNQLTAAAYPYEIVQLRYTQHADNGPVDTSLVTFVEDWNRRFSSPRLSICNLDSLFVKFEQQYGSQLPVLQGEISPYWEDGAYSTLKEETANRELAARTIRLETWARRKGLYDSNRESFYKLHRDVVMFHEHTWGSWCSISDPDLPFTREQWEYKKNFLDSGIYRFNLLAQQLGFREAKISGSRTEKSTLTDFTIDPATGGLSSLRSVQREWVDTTGDWKMFQMIYTLGTDTLRRFSPEQVKLLSSLDNRREKRIHLAYSLKGLSKAEVTYALDKTSGELNVTCRIGKLPVREKESLHLALPVRMKDPQWKYGDTDHLLTYAKDQLPGSNYDFVCAEDRLICSGPEEKLEFISTGPNLFEMGSLVDERKVLGAKQWKPNPEHSSLAFLYVLNNYWHTNFKADQEGDVEFSIRVRAH